MTEQEKPERTCRYSHGPLQQIEGTWSLPGIEWRPHMRRDKTTGHRPTDNGTTFTVTLWRCPVCRYVEMSDEDGDKEE